MLTNFQKVKEFHQAFNVRVGEAPELLPYDRECLRVELIREEFEEFKEALVNHDLVESVDALVDLLYVTYGALVEMGVDADEVFAHVHESNMSKLDENSDPILREDGKILKGPNYWKVELAQFCGGSNA